MASLGERLKDKLHEAVKAGIQDVVPLVYAEVKKELIADASPAVSRILEAVTAHLHDRSSTVLLLGLFIFVLVPWLALLKFLLFSW